jgi:hypothetical protein
MDECERVATGRGVEPDEREDPEFAVGGDVAGRELSPGETSARRYRAERAKGLKHRAAGGTSNHAWPAAERARALALYGSSTAGRWMCGSSPPWRPNIWRAKTASGSIPTPCGGGWWRRDVEPRPQARAASPATRARGALWRTRSARWQFPRLVQDTRTARLLDEPGGRCDRSDAGSAGGRRNNLGGGRCAAPMDRGVRRAPGALHRLEECVCAGRMRRSGSQARCP